MDRKPVGFQLKMLNHLFERRLHCVHPLGNDEVTGNGCRIIGYIMHRADRDIFQRDLEREFGVRRSTMTGILQVMEKQGLILRLPVDSDARLKRLVLTQRAKELHERVHIALRENEQAMLRGFTPEEMTLLNSFLERMKENLTDMKERSE